MNSKEKLSQELFLVVVAQLKKKIEDGTYTHQDMKNAIEFLKNNQITTDLDNPNIVENMLNDMDGVLPFSAGREEKQ